MRTIIFFLSISSCLILHSQEFVSIYGSHAQTQAVADAIPSSSHDYLSPITYVDLNHVTDRISDFCQYELKLEIRQEPTLQGDKRFEMKVARYFGEVVLSFELDVEQSQDAYYVTSMSVTGVEGYVIDFFVSYWPHGFNPEYNQEFTYRFGHDEVVISKDHSTISVRNSTVSTKEEFLRLLAKGKD